ncbi:hypothetical protein CEXT_511791 [Caerostris extrusa]|uniref:Uncharacterized protein n=1 Tax=Caerostris extrusa TaxID=172846 RepID=A0AAV4MB45_CAEEX|nr:hypothetical protein CEXT_511791 [Caerostris extrusa]
MRHKSPNHPYSSPPKLEVVRTLCMRRVAFIAAVEFITGFVWGESDGIMIMNFLSIKSFVIRNNNLILNFHNNPYSQCDTTRPIIPIHRHQNPILTSGLTDTQPSNNSKFPIRHNSPNHPYSSPSKSNPHIWSHQLSTFVKNYLP